LYTKSSYACDDIFYILGLISDNFGATFEGLSLREIIKAMIEVSANTEKFLTAINVITEINIVYFIDITFIHISF